MIEYNFENKNEPVPTSGSVTTSSVSWNTGEVYQAFKKLFNVNDKTETLVGVQIDEHGIAARFKVKVTK